MSLAQPASKTQAPDANATKPAASPLFPQPLNQPALGTGTSTSLFDQKSPAPADKKDSIFGGATATVVG